MWLIVYVYGRAFTCGRRKNEGAVHKVMFQFDVIFLGKKQKHARENLLQYVFHTLGTKAIDGSEIRTLFLAIHMNMTFS